MTAGPALPHDWSPADGALIRAARLPEDAEGIARVYVTSAVHHASLDPGFYQVPEVSLVAERYRAAGAHDPPDTLVAELNRLVVGMAQLTELPPPSPASMIAPVRTGSVDVAVLDGRDTRPML